MKRLLNLLNFLGGSVLRGVDAIWGAFDFLTRPQPRRYITPPRGQFEGLSVSVGTRSDLVCSSDRQKRNLFD